MIITFNENCVTIIITTIAIITRQLLLLYLLSFLLVGKVSKGILTKIRA